MPALAAAAAAAADPACSDVRACIAFPAWMHNYLAALHPRLAGCSGFDLVKLVRSLADLGYKPARPFLADFAAAVEVSECVFLLGGGGWVAFGSCCYCCDEPCRALCHGLRAQLARRDSAAAIDGVLRVQRATLGVLDGAFLTRSCCCYQPCTGD
jgi:hypothetical protein